jgi:hypothetical protein
LGKAEFQMLLMKEALSVKRAPARIRAARSAALPLGGVSGEGRGGRLGRANPENQTGLSRIKPEQSEKKTSRGDLMIIRGEPRRFLTHVGTMNRPNVE